MKRKILAGLMITTLLFTMVGCGKGKAPASASNLDEDGQPKSIAIFYH